MANEQNAKRARRAVHDIIETNKTKYTKLITLTYAENMQDYDRLAHDFKVWRRALQRKGINFPYLYIVEKQKRGALHIHAVVFTNDFLDKDTISKHWPHGFVDLRATKPEQHDNLGAYVAKYITKDSMPPDRKAYRTSRNIKKPTVTKTFGEVGEATERLMAEGMMPSDIYKYTREMHGKQAERAQEDAEAADVTVITFRRQKP